MSRIATRVAGGPWSFPYLAESTNTKVLSQNELAYLHWSLFHRPTGLSQCRLLYSVGVWGVYVSLLYVCLRVSSAAGDRCGPLGAQMTAVLFSAYFWAPTHIFHTRKDISCFGHFLQVALRRTDGPFLDASA